ncbi:hypothetical protein [Nocardia sp. NPDC051570]|uniref:hypothetical protein n=1 Tax=Nocardia sp. NPDC051570 TaxID=3364324 RepID=UPI0037A313C1
MSITRLIALLGGPVLVAGMALATAGPAQADTVDDCPPGLACGYSGNVNVPPTVLAAEPRNNIKSGQRNTGQTQNIDRFVNNTDPYYTSWGNFVLSIPGVLCVYVPDTTDEQAPDTVETTGSDDAAIDAVQFGQTAAEADAISVVALSMCG